LSRQPIMDQQQKYLMDIQTKYEALQRSHDALLHDVAEKDKLIESLCRENQRLQSQVDSFETTLSSADSLESASSKDSDYGRNLGMVAHCVTSDELKFMEDLSREKDSDHHHDHHAVPPRSSIMKKSHTDAEEEFFLLSVLSAKIDLATKGCSNAAVSDISPQSLWNQAQDECIAMHQFHDWIMSQLLSVYQNTQSSTITISHKWQSDGTILSREREMFVADRAPKVTPRGVTVGAVQIKQSMLRVTPNPEQTAKYTLRSSPQQMMEEEQILSEDSEAEEW